MNERYQQIKKLQQKAIAIDSVYGKTDLIQAIKNKSIDDKTFIRKIYSMAFRSGSLNERIRVYYELEQVSPRVFNWNIKLDKPSDSLFVDGSARFKINDGYHRSFIKPDLNKYVFVENGDDDYLISFKDEFSLIPSLIRDFSIFKNKILETDNKKSYSKVQLLYKFKKFKLKDGTKNIIAALILAFGLILASFIYAYANRYSVDMPLRIDKWNGTYQVMVEKK